ncbi:SF1B family DNA helicase RecD2 [Desulfospira joergensenii]|uniref:SF1B family DNA helicase RecD2 n=1 Tax=Desulfospira joergensenii TaxID=53329 RepID=UPI0003B55E29|nr:ATP-dependent RecD-like DNA helicase [Desulfospira joergensenii]
MIKIKGVLTRLTYQNPENHYTVCRIRVDKIHDPITVVGHLGGVAEGETLDLTGKWISHPRYGDQFQADSFQVSLPATVSGIRKYLGSGMIQGISRSLADRIVDQFQEHTLEIIENEPKKLLEVHGIGRAKKRLIEKAWNTHHSVRRVMQFLQDHGVGISHAGTILKTYGPRSLDVLETDPYLIARDIPGIDFRVIDSLARARGVEKEDTRRLSTCLICRLRAFEQEGHVYAEKKDLFALSARTAGVKPEDLEEALDDLADQEEVKILEVKTVEEPESDPEREELQEPGAFPGKIETRVYLSRLFRAETGIASRIKALLSMPRSGHSLSGEEILEQVLTSLAVKLSKEQLEVVSRVLACKISVITGGPGTGKTTLVRALCAVFSKLDQTVVLSAPTGRAARRLSEVTGKKAFTLHKLLGFNQETGDFERNFTNPLALDVFVVDEASMVDTLLMYRAVEALPARARLILVGDTFQLPSVGPGNVLSDIIQSGRVESFFLTKIFRQAQESPIITHAHSIRNGEMPDLKQASKEGLSEFYFIENQEPGKVVETILELCAQRIPHVFPHVEEVQVLTPMHRGDAGTINLNQRLQAVLNPDGEGIQARGLVFRPGDKVMHLKNNYEKDVFNGDIGRVLEVDRKEGQVVVDYEGRSVVYDILELDELTLAYAVSVHKSQGSEYPAVIIALTTAHFPLLQRNLIYTAMTRGRELVIIVGSSRAFEIAFGNNRTAQRLSGLREMLVQE